MKVKKKEEDEFVGEKKFNVVGKDGDVHQPAEEPEMLGEIGDQPTRYHVSEIVICIMRNHIRIM